jgi:hypothetical protein
MTSNQKNNFIPTLGLILRPCDFAPDSPNNPNNQQKTHIIPIEYSLFGCGKNVDVFCDKNQVNHFYNDKFSARVEPPFPENQNMVLGFDIFSKDQKISLLESSFCLSLVRDFYGIAKNQFVGGFDKSSISFFFERGDFVLRYGDGDKKSYVSSCEKENILFLDHLFVYFACYYGDGKPYYCQVFINGIEEKNRLPISFFNIPPSMKLFLTSFTQGLSFRLFLSCDTPEHCSLKKNEIVVKYKVTNGNRHTPSAKKKKKEEEEESVTYEEESVIYEDNE